MAIDPKLIANFEKATEGLDRAIRLNDEALCSYYLGLTVGILSAALPENEVQRLVSVSARGGNALNAEVGGVISKATEIFRAQLLESTDG